MFSSYLVLKNRFSSTKKKHAKMDPRPTVPTKTKTGKDPTNPNKNGQKYLRDQKTIGSVYGIFTYVYHKNQPNVGKYTSPMDPIKNDDPTFKTSWGTKDPNQLRFSLIAFPTQKHRSGPDPPGRLLWHKTCDIQYHDAMWIILSQETIEILKFHGAIGAIRISFHGKNLHRDSLASRLQVPFGRNFGFRLLVWYAVCHLRLDMFSFRSCGCFGEQKWRLYKSHGAK